MDLIDSLGVFARIAELGSFSAVARELRQSHSAVTRQIGNLEERFKARLFHRNTRGLALTEDGRELLGYARQMLDLAETMDSAVKRQREIPQGLVRLGVPTAISIFLVPRLPKLFERFPGLSIELFIRDHTFDLVEERLDLALQIGHPRSNVRPTAQARPVGGLALGTQNSLDSACCNRLQCHHALHLCNADVIDAGASAETNHQATPVELALIFPRARCG